MEDIFFDILRIGIGTSDFEVHMLSEEELDEVYAMASKHKLLGVVFVGIQSYIKTLKNKGIPESEIISRKKYLKWLGASNMISLRNESLDKQGKIIQSRFKEAGFSTCILKGQGVAKYYGELSSIRQSGDIDIWVWPKDDWTLGHKARINKVMTFLTSKCKHVKPSYHHVEITTFQRIKIEVHYTPSWMFSPIHNHKLQKWFALQAPVEMQNEFSTIEFNRFYILLHIYRHLFFEGIGLRQIIDYYFVLKSKKITEEECLQTLQLFKSLGLSRFASAMMWILNEKLGLPIEYLICKPNEKEGLFLLSEILQAGDFGRYDKRIHHKSGRNLFVVFCLHVSRNLHFLTHYPSEALWCPLWKVWHQLWIRFL